LREKDGTLGRKSERISARRAKEVLCAPHMHTKTTPAIIGFPDRRVVEHVNPPSTSSRRAYRQPE
jgi:hypothetical protein